MVLRIPHGNKPMLLGDLLLHIGEDYLINSMRAQACPSMTPGWEAAARRLFRAAVDPAKCRRDVGEHEKVWLEKSGGEIKALWTGPDGTESLACLAQPKDLFYAKIMPENADQFFFTEYMAHLFYNIAYYCEEKYGKEGC